MNWILTGSNVISKFSRFSMYIIYIILLTFALMGTSAGIGDISLLHSFLHIYKVAQGHCRFKKITPV